MTVLYTFRSWLAPATVLCIRENWKRNFMFMSSEKVCLLCAWLWNDQINCMKTSIIYGDKVIHTLVVCLHHISFYFVFCCFPTCIYIHIHVIYTKAQATLSQWIWHKKPMYPFLSTTYSDLFDQNIRSSCIASDLLGTGVRCVSCCTLKTGLVNPFPHSLRNEWKWYKEFHFRGLFLSVHCL